MEEFKFHNVTLTEAGSQLGSESMSMELLARRDGKRYEWGK